MTMDEGRGMDWQRCRRWIYFLAVGGLLVAIKGAPVEAADDPIVDRSSSCAATAIAGIATARAPAGRARAGPRCGPPDTATRTSGRAGCTMRRGRPRTGPGGAPHKK